MCPVCRDDVLRGSSLTCTFCRSLEEHLAASAGESAVVTPGRLVCADQAGPLGREEELHGEHVLPAALEPSNQTQGRFQKQKSSTAGLNRSVWGKTPHVLL